jgi:hypothetical protein
MSWLPSIAYPSSQDDLYPINLDPTPINEWIFFGPPIVIRAGVAYCPICDAIMDNPLTWMTFDYCPVYLLVCPVCSYEDSIQ